LLPRCSSQHLLQQVLDILSRNRERLLEFMSKFHQDNDNERVCHSTQARCADAAILPPLPPSCQFVEDRELILQEMQQLPPCAALQNPQ
jgi:hypothetical protein